MPKGMKFFDVAAIFFPCQPTLVSCPDVHAPREIMSGVLIKLSRHRHLSPLEFQRQIAAFSPSVKLP